MTEPGKIMEMVAGQAANAFDFKAGISKYMLGFILIVWLSNWIIVRKGIAHGIEKASKLFTPLLMVLMIILTTEVS